MSNREAKFENNLMFATIAQNIRELSDVTDYGNNDPFREMAADQRLQYINDLALGMIDLLEPRTVS